MSFDDLFTPEAAEQRRIAAELRAAEARVVEASINLFEQHQERAALFEWENAVIAVRALRASEEEKP